MTLCLTFKKWRIHLVVQDEGFSVLSQRFDPAMRYKKWGSGGIGRRAGLRSQWDHIPCGFESHLPYKKINLC